MLDRAGVGAQQILEPLEILRRGVGIGLRGLDVGLRGLDLCGGLPDVLDARAGAQQRKLRLRLVALRFRPAQRQRRVGGVDVGDDVAGSDAIPFGHSHVEQAAAHFRGDADLRRFDVAGGAIGRRVGAALAGDEHQGAQDEGPRDHRPSHASLPSSSASASC